MLIRLPRVGTKTRAVVDAVHESGAMGLTFTRCLDVYCAGNKAIRTHAGMNLTRILKEYCAKNGKPCSKGRWYAKFFTDVAYAEKYQGPVCNVKPEPCKECEELAARNQRQYDEIKRLQSSQDKLAKANSELSGKVIRLNLELNNQNNEMVELRKQLSMASAAKYYDDGYRAGNADGLANGRRIARKDAEKDFAIAKAVEYDKGFNCGRVVGFDEGRVTGRRDGYTAGLDDGTRTTIEKVQKSKTVGYDAGYAVGKAVGCDETLRNISKQQASPFFTIDQLNKAKEDAYTHGVQESRQVAQDKLENAYDRGYTDGYAVCSVRVKEVLK